MKLISYSLKNKNQTRVAILLNEKVFDIELEFKIYASKLGITDIDKIPNTMISLLKDWDFYSLILKNLENILKEDQTSSSSNDDNKSFDLSQINFHSPVPVPNSFRDFYAFEQHVKTARAGRNLEMVPEWYDIPAFYFSNHNAFMGHEQLLSTPKNTKELDFELEIACIIGKEGKDIKLSEAHNYIVGYSILNDWSARDLQRQEMKVGLGPVKGKDFATIMGPCLVTPDEIALFKKNKGYDLKMTARKNGEIISEGNWADIYYSFEEMIVRASENVTLYPGDVLGSGTVGTGCILELRPENTNGWLQPGDEIELEIEKFGVLKNKII